MKKTLPYQSLSPKPGRWERLRRKTLVMVIASCALAGLLSIVSQRQELLAYMPINATVVDVAVHTRTDSAHGTTQYIPAVRFEYMLYGAIYHSDQYSRDSQAGTKAHAEKLIASYKPGEHVTAYYEPTNAGGAFLVRNVHFAPYALAMLPAIVGAVLYRKRIAGVVLALIVVGALGTHYYMLAR